MCDVTSCLSCLSSLSRLVSFRMRSSITITEKANTLLTVTTRIVRLIISGTLGYFGTNHFSNPNTSKTAQQKVQCLSNFSHIKSQVESTSSAIRSTIIEMSLTQVFTGSQISDKTQMCDKKICVRQLFDSDCLKALETNNCFKQLVYINRRTMHAIFLTKYNG